MDIREYQPIPGRKVEVYRNLHTGTLSVRDAKTKRVVGHAHAVMLENATLRVSEAGRLRAVREGRRNVHAFAVGFETSRTLAPAGDRISYNPFKAPYFYVADTQAAAKLHGDAVVVPAGVYAARGRR